ncbi:MAG: hypothetical protein KHX63_01505 [Veillonella sp.]|jgi:hypothetical protein|uniref:hypothetical protein n=1 Tax=Veillonella sp. TaxID=1926307 RepID=UPI0020643822|nr:hypothetical protein [Veillonella sp.]MBS5407428.1 hypothetical protein [Veillonella sp.]DAR15595.1 MAG TPA: hypothetical protein [Caudoviricetes sp.]
MKKLVKANDLTYTCEQFSSALTIVIGNRILKPKISANSYCIMVEYSIPNGKKHKRLRQVISKANLQHFNGTMELCLYHIKEQIKHLLIKGELNYDE